MGNGRTNDFLPLSPSLSLGQQGQCAAQFYLGLIFSKQTRIGTLVLLLLWMGPKKKKKEKSSRKQRVWQQRCWGACLLFTWQIVLQNLFQCLTQISIFFSSLTPVQSPEIITDFGWNYLSNYPTKTKNRIFSLLFADSAEADALLDL